MEKKFAEKFISEEGILSIIRNSERYINVVDLLFEEASASFINKHLQSCLDIAEMEGEENACYNKEMPSKPGILEKLKNFNKDVGIKLTNILNKLPNSSLEKIMAQQLYQKHGSQKTMKRERD